MRGFDNFRNPRARAALIAAVGLLLGGSVGGVALAQSQQQGKAPYHSSIQVPDDKNEKGEQNEADDEQDEKSESEKGEQDEKNEKGEQNEKGEKGEQDEARGGGEANDPAEQAEAARFQHLARITADQARTAALARVPGTVMSVELENEDGNLVYGVSVKTAAGERDVKVDAGNGAVLHIEQD